MHRIKWEEPGCALVVRWLHFRSPSMTGSSWQPGRDGSRPVRRWAMRSHIVLLAAEGYNNKIIAARLHTIPHTVGKWRRRYLELGPRCLLVEPRPGTSRKLGDEQVERVLTRTLESQPQAATHWSTRDMARACGLSQSSISHIWRAFSLAPHRAESFKLSRDPLFIEKVRGIVGLSLAPPEEPLCCASMRRARSKRSTARRLYCPCAPARSNAARTIMRAMERPRCLPPSMPKAAPPGLDVHLILDNYGTHKTQLIRDWLVKRPRFHLHFTPTPASWLNLLERWFALLTEKQLRRGVHRSTKELKRPSAATFNTTTKIQSRSCGAKLPTRSSIPSHDFVQELQTQDNRHDRQKHFKQWRRNRYFAGPEAAAQHRYVKLIRGQRVQMDTYKIAAGVTGQYALIARAELD
jgi:transposase